MPDPKIVSQFSSSTSAYARHLQRADAYVRFYGGSAPPPSPFRTERDILEQHHRFIRDGNGDSASTDSISEEKLLAKKYYDGLFREFALVDLSLWKYQKVAMRWRTKAEVLAGTGQFSCGSLSCRQHNEIVERNKTDHRGLQILELNFAYEEAGEKKNALVKVCLCRKCERLLQKSKLTRDMEPERRRTEIRRHGRHDRSAARSRSPVGEEEERPVTDGLRMGSETIQRGLRTSRHPRR